jgi:hypothetical protein
LVVTFDAGILFSQKDKKIRQHFKEVNQNKQESALILFKLFESERKIPIILGALTGRMIRFLKKNGIQSPLITGIYLTPYLISGMIKKVATIVEEAAFNYKIALVGGADNMGQAILNWLIVEGFQNIIIIEDSNIELNSIKNKYMSEIRQQYLHLTTNIGAVREKDIVIVATALPPILIKTNMLTPGTIIIDDTHPSNVAKSVVSNKVAVLGVMAKVPKLKYDFSMDQMSKNETVTSLAEGSLVMASNNRLIRAYDEVYASDNRKCQLDLIRKIAQRGGELGITFANFRDYNSYISDRCPICILSVRRQTEEVEN